MHNQNKFVVYYKYDGKDYYHMFPELDLAFIFFSMLDGQTQPILMKRPDEPSSNM